ncbi:MAG: DUF1570 domain-containing protein [Planctomycetota bacterium]
MALASERLRKQAEAHRVNLSKQVGQVGSSDTRKVAKRAKPTRSRPGVPAAKPTRSRGGVPAAKTAHSNKLALVIGGVFVAAAALGSAVYFATAEKPKPEPQPVVVNGDQKPLVKPESIAPEKTPLDRARETVAEATRLEKANREGDAVHALDTALEDFKTFDAKKLLDDARTAILGRFKTRIAEATKLLDRGELAAARGFLLELRGRCPDALVPQLAGLQGRAEALANTPVQPAEQGPRVEPVAETPKVEKAEKTEKTEKADAEPARPDLTASERARFAIARTQVTRALAELDVETAKKALFGDATPFTSKTVQEQFELDKKRIEAVEKLLDLIVEGFKPNLGQSIELALRSGGRVAGKLAKVEKTKVSLQPGQSPLTVSTPLAKIALEPLFARALNAAKSAPEWYFFGRGVVLACAGDRARALEALELAAALPAATALRAQLASDDATLAPAPDTSSTTSGPIVIGPEGVIDENKPKRPKTWMDDTEGGVEWSQKYVIETPHYVIKTNVKKEYAKRWAKILEALAEKYIKIFNFQDNDFKYKKNEFDLYRTQKEFMAHEQMSAYVGGFYEPWTKRLVTFQGPWEGADDATTLSIIAHEATHQFENLVLRQLDHAPTFVIEGLATFFEGTVIRDEEVIIGRISSMRLKDLQRAIKDGSYIKLSELIRTSHAAYSGFHYAHGWGLVHWMMYGPEAKKAQKLLEAYWNLCCTRPTTGDDFETMVKGLGAGWSLEKLEQSWKDWIMGLDIHNDPAVKAYEKKTGKKFPVEDYEPSAKEKKEELKAQKNLKTPR